MTEFERDLTRFGLLADNKWVFCILPDEKLTVHEQKEVIALTGAELVKVHAKAKFTMVKEISRKEYSPSAIDLSVIQRKDAFKSVRNPKLNKPIDVEFTENILTEIKSETTSVIFCNAENQMYDIPENMPSDEKAQIAKLLRADIVVAKFEVHFKLLPKASPYRSQAKV